MSIVSKILHRSNGNRSNDLVEVGWLLKSNQGSFLWDAPKLFRRKDVQPAIAKSVSRCPAIIDLESRFTEKDPFAPSIYVLVLKFPKTARTA